MIPSHFQVVTSEEARLSLMPEVRSSNFAIVSRIAFCVVVSVVILSSSVLNAPVTVSCKNFTRSEIISKLGCGSLKRHSFLRHDLNHRHKPDFVCTGKGIPLRCVRDNKRRSVLVLSNGREFLMPGFPRLRRFGVGPRLSVLGGRRNKDGERLVDKFLCRIPEGIGGASVAVDNHGFPGVVRFGCDDKGRERREHHEGLTAPYQRRNLLH